MYSGVRRIYFSRGRKKFKGGQKKIQGGQTHARRARKNFLPPLFFFCPPGRIQFCPPWGRTDKRWGQKTLLYLEKEGETFNNRSLSKSQLTVLFFLTLCTQKPVLNVSFKNF